MEKIDENLDAKIDKTMDENFAKYMEVFGNLMELLSK